MAKEVNVGIIGDYDPEKPSHLATNGAIRHAAAKLGLKAKNTWLPTPSMLTRKGQRSLALFDCLWASSGSEAYKSHGGMLKGIQIARRSGRPFIAT